MLAPFAHLPQLNLLYHFGELLCLCCVAAIKSLPAHSFNARSFIAILRDCLYHSLEMIRRSYVSFMRTKHLVSYWGWGWYREICLNLQWFFADHYFVDTFCYLCFMVIFVMLSFLFLAALWSSAGKQLASWLFCVLCFLGFLSISHVEFRVRYGT